MDESLKKLRRLQIQENIDDFLTLAQKPLPRMGWIRMIRIALGIPVSFLAKKLGCSSANITSFEKREKLGTITLNKLDEIAQALNCRLVYSIVPMSPINQILEKQAKNVARKQIGIVNHSMGLEMQELDDKQLKQQEKLLVEKLLQGNPKYLWIDDEI